MKVLISLMFCAILAAVQSKATPGGFRGRKIECDDMSGSCETFDWGGPPMCSVGSPRAKCKPSVRGEGYSLCCATDDNVAKFCEDQGGNCAAGTYDNTLGYPAVMNDLRRSARRSCGEGSRPFRPMLFCSLNMATGTVSTCCVPEQ